MSNDGYTLMHELISTDAWINRVPHLSASQLYDLYYTDWTEYHALYPEDQEHLYNQVTKEVLVMMRIHFLKAVKSRKIE